MQEKYVMTKLQREYQELEHELWALRDSPKYNLESYATTNVGEEEDVLLARMEEIWWEMDEEERELFFLI